MMLQRATPVLLLVLAMTGAAAAINAQSLRTAPVVETPYGKVSGIVDQDAFAYKGVPYAAPPVGALRFAATQEAVPYNGVLNASEFASGCMAECKPFAFPRPDIMCTPTVSEDCLYLNVYTPNATMGAGLPVIVFFHGGNYVGGSGGVPIYDGAVLAKTQNVVVVTINYRLGVFGALFTGTVRGNFQTMDQRQSLIWVQRSIAGFGGNPNLVTITGQSAGAFSVATHLASPLSWPYFHRAVIISDPFSLLALDAPHAMQLGEKFLAAAGCPTGGELELACLRNLSAERILEIQASPLDFTPLPGQLLIMMMPWVPVVEGKQLPFQPLFALTNGKFNRVPVMFGTTANESVQFVYDLSTKPMAAFDYYALLAAIFGLDNVAKINEEYGAVPEAAKNDTRMWMSPLVTDYIFYAVNRFVGTALARHVPTFMYLFDKVASWNEWVFGEHMPWCVDVVCHASDLPFIFNPFGAVRNMSHPVPTAAENRLIDFMQTAYGNFARGGSPNPLPQSIVWPQFDGSLNNLVNLSTPVSPLTGYRNQQCDFWDKIGYYRF